MPRRREVPKRIVLPDPKFKSQLVTKFMSCLMQRGKKSLAEAILYGALDSVESKVGKPSIEVFEQALENVKPLIEVKSRRVGGSNYQVPVEVRPGRQLSLGMRWLIDFSKKRTESTMADRLAGELIDAYNKRGAAIKKREDTHRMAEANKAFAHFRW